jgi:hypothetical protein
VQELHFERGSDPHLPTPLHYKLIFAYQFLPHFLHIVPKILFGFELNGVAQAVSFG